MKNFYGIVDEVKRDFDFFGINYDKSAKVGITYRLKRDAVATTYRTTDRISGKMKHEIYVCSILLEDVVPELFLRSCIAHELLHTSKNGFTHEGEWAEQAMIVNCLMGLDVVESSDMSVDNGLSPELYIKHYSKFGYRFK